MRMSECLDAINGRMVVSAEPRVNGDICVLIAGRKS